MALFLFVLLLDKSLLRSWGLGHRGVGISFAFGLSLSFSRGLPFFRCLSFFGSFSSWSWSRGRLSLDRNFLNFSPLLSQFSSFKTIDPVYIVSHLDDELCLAILISVLKLAFRDLVTGQLVRETFHKLDRALIILRVMN